MSTASDAIDKISEGNYFFFGAVGPGKGVMCFTRKPSFLEVVQM